MVNLNEPLFSSEDLIRMIRSLTVTLRESVKRDAEKAIAPYLQELADRQLETLYYVFHTDSHRELSIRVKRLELATSAAEVHLRMTGAEAITLYVDKERKVLNANDFPINRFCQAILTWIDEMAARGSKQESPAPADDGGFADPFSEEGK